jgi:hypothetical protein
VPAGADVAGPEDDGACVKRVVGRVVVRVVGGLVRPGVVAILGGGLVAFNGDTQSGRPGYVVDATACASLKR